MIGMRARSSEKSNELYLTKLRKKVSEIFQALDSDHDGLISAHQVEITALQTEVLELIAPILLEMESKCISHTFESFC